MRPNSKILLKTRVSLFPAIAIALLFSVNSLQPVHAGVMKKPPSKLVKGTISRSKIKRRTGFQCDEFSAYTDAVFCQVNWAYLQPTQRGALNTTFLDQKLALAKKANKKILLRVNTGVHSPYWVKNTVGFIKWDFKSSSDNYDLPLFWSGAYKGHYERLMSSLARSYDNSPYFSGVSMSMCMTVNAEVMWNRTGRQEVRKSNWTAMTDRQQIISLNGKPKRMGRRRYSNSNDLKCIENMITAHAKYWKKTPSYLAAHLYQIYDKNGTGSASVSKTYPILNRCVDQLGSLCVLGNNSLRSDEFGSDGTPKKKDSIYSVIAATRSNYAKKQITVPVSYQTNVFNNDKRSKDYFGGDALIKTLQIAAKLDAESVELPMGWNCLNIYTSDTNNTRTCNDRSFRTNEVNMRQFVQARNALK